MEKERSGIKFGIIVGSRNFFPKELAKNGRDAILEKMKEMGFGCIILSPTETPLGVVETYQDAKKCAELFAKHREEIDGIIIVLPTAFSFSIIFESNCPTYSYIVSVKKRLCRLKRSWIAMKYPSYIWIFL